jgi:rhodanese-related sulfurtransferase
MRKSVSALGVAAVVIGFSSVAVAHNCADHSSEESAKKEVTIEQILAETVDISIEDLDKALASKSAPAIYDANGDATRERYGIIPGARLLTSSTEYDMEVLPRAQDAALVFYCGGPKCMAAPKAAHRAKEAGYTDVKVLRAGISGWKKAGKQVDKPSS